MWHNLSELGQSIFRPNEFDAIKQKQRQGQKEGITNRGAEQWQVLRRSVDWCSPLATNGSNSWEEARHGQEGQFFWASYTFIRRDLHRFPLIERNWYVMRLSIATGYFTSKAGSGGYSTLEW
jgi:hypothetical protein